MEQSTKFQLLNLYIYSILIFIIFIFSLSVSQMFPFFPHFFQYFLNMFIRECKCAEWVEMLGYGESFRYFVGLWKACVLHLHGKWLTGSFAVEDCGNICFCQHVYVQQFGDVLLQAGQTDFSCRTLCHGAFRQIFTHSPALKTIYIISNDFPLLLTRSPSLCLPFSLLPLDWHWPEIIVASMFCLKSQL